MTYNDKGCRNAAFIRNKDYAIGERVIHYNYNGEFSIKKNSIMCPGLVCPILSLLEDDLCSIHEVMDVIETKKPYLSKAEVVNETHNFLDSMLSSAYIEVYSYNLKSGDFSLLDNFVFTKNYLDRGIIYEGIMYGR